MPQLMFHGAAGEVTGSMHLVQMDGRWIALDCGLFQGRREQAEQKNRQWPIPPDELAAVVVSHAHTDHTGRLPLLHRDGFRGDIFCTPATRDLCAIMLPDSAHIQEEDTHYINKKRRKKGLPAVEALYGLNDAIGAIELMRTIANNRWFEVIPGVRASYVEAGHILGSAGIQLAFGKRNGSATTLYFTGDVGRPHKPIIQDPAPFPPCDVLICESTYGGRVTPVVQDAKSEMFEAVRRTLNRRGKVIIPAFAVGRAQTLVYYLQEWMDAGTLPCVPVYVDSPMTVNATEVFRMHPELWDTEARRLNQHSGDFLRNRCVTYVQDVEASKALHQKQDPCVIISASGMCEAGRIRHHIKNNIGNSRNMILVPGFQAADTLGRRLVEGAKQIRLFHEDYAVNAEVLQIHGLSAHADQSDLLAMLTPLAGATRRVFLVHGEDDQRNLLREKLLPFGFEVTLPIPGTTAEI